MSDWFGWLAPSGKIYAGIYACAHAGYSLASKKKLYGGIPGGVQPITTVCYFFCLSAYLTGMAGGWLVWSGQVSKDGLPVSYAAKLAFLVAGESIDYDRELIVIACLMSIVVLPQLANYLVAGLFGAAGGTKFGAWCLRVVFWAILKAVAVAGGVSVGWGAVALFLRWHHAYDTAPQELLGRGLSQIAISVTLTTFAGPLEDTSLAAIRAALAPMTRPLMPIHLWLTRHTRGPKVDAFMQREDSQEGLPLSAGVADPVSTQPTTASVAR